MRKLFVVTLLSITLTQPGCAIALEILRNLAGAVEILNNMCASDPQHCGQAASCQAAAAPVLASGSGFVQLHKAQSLCAAH
jgi:hypothetical protein